MTQSKWVHRDEFESMKALYEIRINNLVDELAYANKMLDDYGVSNNLALPQFDEDNIQDAEIVED